MKSGTGDQGREGASGGWPVGDDHFKREIARALKCRVTPLPPGRPRPAMTLTPILRVHLLAVPTDSDGLLVSISMLGNNGKCLRSVFAI